MWKAIKYTLIYFGFQLLGALITMIPGAILNIDKSIIIVLALALSSLLFCWYIVQKGEVLLDKETFTIRAEAILILAVVAVAFFLLPEVELIERLDIPDELGEDLHEVSGSLLGLISIGIIGPIGEEFLFRGAVLRSLLEWRPLRAKPWIAVLLSAAFFSMAHMNPAQMPGSFMMGLFFGWIAYRTGSLLPGIVCHVFNNSLSCIMVMLSTEESAEETVAEMFNSPILEILAIAGSLFLCIVTLWAIVREVNKHYPPRNSFSALEDNKGEVHTYSSHRT